VSQENVEILLAMRDAWNDGDMDRLRAFYDHDVITRLPEGWPEPGPFVGVDAVMRQWERNRETWSADTLALGDFTEAGDRLVVRLTWTGIGRVPGMSLEFTAIYTFREGKVCDQESFWDHSDALKAVGMEE
jgi:ketosteroid isomerase-like protein